MTIPHRGAPTLARLPLALPAGHAAGPVADAGPDAPPGPRQIGALVVLGQVVARVALAG
jgi:hypothetical protein